MSSPLPDRTPATAEQARLAVLSRPAVVVAAVAALVGVLVGAIFGTAGAAIGGGIAFGLLGWIGAAVAVALGGPRSAGARIDPFTLGEPWRQFVRAALQVQARYDARVVRTPPGPLRERLIDIGLRIDRVVGECWLVAQRGDGLDDAIEALDVPALEHRLEALAAGDADETTVRMRESLLARLDTAQRMRQVADDARDRLRILDARLGEAVARGVELSVQSDVGTEAVGLGEDVDDLVLELSALRSALEETSGPTPPSLGGPSES